jgi:hypothetical protein
MINTVLQSVPRRNAVTTASKKGGDKQHQRACIEHPLKTTLKNTLGQASKPPQYLIQQQLQHACHHAQQQATLHNHNATERNTG